MLDCITGEGLSPEDICRGKISTGRKGPQRFYEGDRYQCPKCRVWYTIGITDDYEDDRYAFLIRDRQPQFNLKDGPKHA